MTRAIARALLAALALVLVDSCTGADDGQARLCRSVLPAIEPAGPIRVLAIEADQAAAHGVAISYAAPENPAAMPARVRCIFAGGRLDKGRYDLLGVAVNDLPISDIRLFMLKRFWLADPDAIRDGERRLEGLDGRTPVVPVAVDAATGYALQQVVNVVPLGAVYALLAAAFALVHGLVNRVNLAFGETAVLGAHAVVATLGGLSAGLAAGVLGAVPAVMVALTVALGQAVLLGAVLGETVFRPLARVDARRFLVASLGLAIALSETIRLFAGSRDRWIQPLLGDIVVLADGDFRVTTTVIQLVETAVAGSALLALFVLLGRTAFGRAWRAVADDPTTARLFGIDPDRLAILVFALASGLAGLAGAVHALHYGHASYSAGLALGLKALMAALIGGVGSVGGAAAGGFAIAAAEVLWAAYLPHDSRDIAILGGLVILFVLKPAGLAGWSGRADGGASPPGR